MSKVDGQTAAVGQDQVEELAGSLIQHGKENNRVYLMEYRVGKDEALLDAIDRLCRENGYTKVFAKVPEQAAPRFLAAGYRIEAYVPGFYRGVNGGFFLGYYYDEKRAEPPVKELEVLGRVMAGDAGKSEALRLPEGWEIYFPGREDCSEMAQLYAKIFPRYPFPIHDRAYLEQTMKENVLYAGVRHQGRLLGLASAEMCRREQHAEMTDFAVLPEARGKKLGLLLLKRLEEEMPAYNMRTLYTIARLASPGMNLTFARRGYHYSGTLPRNTSISGGLESMNVWYRRLD